MRVAGRTGLLYKILFIEAGIIFLVCAIFYNQFGAAKTEVINRTVAASELIGDEAAEFILHSENPTSGEFQTFLRSKHGQGGIFETFDVEPASFRVIFMKEMRDKQASDFYSEKGYGVRDTGRMFSVTVPFLTGADGRPYGVVTIDSSKRMIMRKVLGDNFLLYLALFVVLNNQVFILYYLFSKRQKDIIDRNYARPYLKQHSIGALRVMRKILDEIVEDNPEEPQGKEAKTQSSETGKKSGSRKIISISQFLSRNS